MHKQILYNTNRINIKILEKNQAFPTDFEKQERNLGNIVTRINEEIILQKFDSNNMADLPEINDIILLGSDNIPYFKYQGVFFDFEKLKKGKDCYGNDFLVAPVNTYELAKLNDDSSIDLEEWGLPIDGLDMNKPQIFISLFKENQKNITPYIIEVAEFNREFQVLSNSDDIQFSFRPKNSSYTLNLRTPTDKFNFEYLTYGKEIGFEIIELKKGLKGQIKSLDQVNGLVRKLIQLPK